MKIYEQMKIHDKMHVCLFEVLVGVDIHSRFRSTRYKAMYSGITGTFEAQMLAVVN
jgi:hypothetical protein